MKNQPESYARKLTLHRETVRTLTTDDLKQAAGGLRDIPTRTRICTTDPPTRLPTWCTC